MQVTVKVNIDANKINDQIERGVNYAIKALQPILVNYAKTHHRYDDQTGNLSNSIQLDQLNMGMRLQANAEYGVFIHDGFKTWQPDPWLEETLKANEDLIIDTMNKYISIELNK